MATSVRKKSTKTWENNVVLTWHPKKWKSSIKWITSLPLPDDSRIWGIVLLSWLQPIHFHWFHRNQYELSTLEALSEWPPLHLHVPLLAEFLYASMVLSWRTGCYVNDSTGGSTESCFAYCNRVRCASPTLSATGNHLVIPLAYTCHL